MTLGEFRRATEGMPENTVLIIMSTSDAEVYDVEDVSTSRPSLLTPVVYLETEIR